MNNIKHIAHVCFSSSDLVRTIAFYQNTFSASIAHEFRNDTNELYGVFLQITPDCYLEFFKAELTSGGSFRHFCIEVNDINALAKDLFAKGLQTEVKRSRSDRTLQCWIEDPDGNRIEFHQYDKSSALFKAK